MSEPEKLAFDNRTSPSPRWPIVYNGREEPMRRAARIALTALGLALMAQLPPAAAQAPGQGTAYRAVACDRACLIGFLHRYMDALTHKDAKRAPFAKDVMFTENDVVMPIGEGLWGTVSGASETGLELADHSTGQAAWYGLVLEHGSP